MPRVPTGGGTGASRNLRCDRPSASPQYPRTDGTAISETGGGKRASDGNPSVRVWKPGVWRDGVWKLGAWVGLKPPGPPIPRKTWLSGIWQAGVWKLGVWVGLARPAVIPTSEAVRVDNIPGAVPVAAVRWTTFPDYTTPPGRLRAEPVLTRAQYVVEAAGVVARAKPRHLPDVVASVSARMVVTEWRVYA